MSIHSLKVEKVYDVAVIGAGPAGTACAIQLHRSGISVILIEKNAVGGLVRNANLIENLLGFPHGIPGLQLARLMEQQLEQNGVPLLFDEITRLSFDTTQKLFLLQGRRTTVARRVVLATGTKPRKLEIFSALEHNQVSSSPFSSFTRTHPLVTYSVCDLLHLRHNRVLVIGAGDAAFDQALQLASQENTVIILNRSNRIKALKLLQKRVFSHPRITYHPNSSVTAAFPSSSPPPEHVQVNVISSSPSSSSPSVKEEILHVDAVLIAIGRIPNTDLLTTLQRVQLLKTQKYLFLIGDVISGRFRQSSIAMGQGIQTAMEIMNLF